MQIDRRHGTFDEIAALGHAPVPRATRALVAELHPDATEVAGPGERAVRWGWGGAKMSGACACAMPHAHAVAVRPARAGREALNP